MEEERNYCVYFHENKINGKLYFGVTRQSTQDRWGKDGNGYKGSPHFFSAIQKYGWDNFYHIVVKRNLTMEEAEDMEKELIALYKTTDPEFGYNMQSGGLLTKHLSEETKQKMRKSKLGKKYSEETKQKVREASLGRKHSEKSKQKIREARLGKKHSEETKQKMREAKLGKTRRKHSEETKQKIREAQIGKPRKKHSEESKQKISEASPRKKKVLCIETGVVYESISAAAIDIEVDQSNISNVIAGRKKSTHGLHFKYYEEKE